jgi:hypothetical protein
LAQEIGKIKDVDGVEIFAPARESVGNPWPHSNAK